MTGRVMNGERTRAIDLVRLPLTQRAPLTAVLRRVGLGLGLVIFVALVVRTGGDGYVDNATGDSVGFLDALYYASVTVTTTGYGDITAVSDGARLATVVLITPARILFLILLVGTTVEVLTDQTRQLLATKRWRNRVDNHHVICGFGATGQSAADDLLARGVDPADIVVVDIDRGVLDEARVRGLVAVEGDATHAAVLRQAAIGRAKSVIVTPNRDDTAVLITLTARELNPDAHIVAGGREQENLHLLRQGGADEVIDATAAVGRMLGFGTYAPGAVQVLEDLLGAGSGLEIAEEQPELIEGVATMPEGSTLVAVIRAGVRLPPHALDASDLREGDRLIVLRESAAS